jgi:hypothetical protein
MESITTLVTAIISSWQGVAISISRWAKPLMRDGQCCGQYAERFGNVSATLSDYRYTSFVQVKTPKTEVAKKIPEDTHAAPRRQ